MVNSEHGTASDSCELTPEYSSLEQDELQVLQVEQGGKMFKKSDLFIFNLLNRMCEGPYESCLLCRLAAFLANLSDQFTEGLEF